MYLQESEAQFVPWNKHRNNYQFMGPLPWPPHTKPEIDHPYSKEEILEYFDLCRRQAEEKIPSMDLDAGSGFYWLPFKKFELQIYNIRHIQHHTGALIDRLRTIEDIGIDWAAAKSRS